jgi:hypothetical protein
MLEEQVKQLKDKLLERDSELIDIKNKYIKLLEEKKVPVTHQ